MLNIIEFSKKFTSIMESYQDFLDDLFHLNNLKSEKWISYVSLYNHEKVPLDQILTIINKI